MKKATITALNKSIATWKRRVKGEHITPSQRNCALCKRFNNSYPSCQFSGEKCPVYERTGADHCERSDAYRTYSSHYENADNEEIDHINYAKSVTGKRRAQKEVDFLKSLLPE